MENIVKNELNDVEIVILAGGKGKRMQSELPKVLAPLSGSTMIMHIIQEIEKLTTKKPIVVVGHKKELVYEHLGQRAIYAVQEEQLGTGHAVACAKDQTNNAKHILVMSGDQPFIKEETLEKLIQTHLETKATITLGTSIVNNFQDEKSAFNFFGRIKRENGKIIGIKEYKDATEEERSIKEVNAGLYIFESDFLWTNLSKLKNENAQGEYYLTDLLKIAKDEGKIIENIEINNKEALGANTKEELETLEKLLTN
jgi:bifunctional UDP-N-acetylglucosamine pyrophosphorylase/glucosamine-1-phosphate N-acetyltransferase